jgi:hypothetical protein
MHNHLVEPGVEGRKVTSQGHVEILQGEKFDKVMDKFQPLCSPNIRNLIASIKHSAGTQGPMDNIFFLKLKNLYDYIQNSCFLKQMVGRKVFLFKMLLYGPTSEVDLVRHM